jgi:hypothetical protein
MNEEREAEIKEVMNSIELTPVASNSGNMEGIGYNLDKKILVAKFGSGVMYGYDGVPDEIGGQLVLYAQNPEVSTGTMFAKHIRNSNFEFVKQ